ncbi:MAG: MFS transporter [Alcaligenaceae bacterium]|nr:MAG: MFS transporter [Alcaligenaceae bacterium]
MLQRQILRRLRYALSVGALALSSAVLAQSTATQPITLLIPYPPGGSADMLARPMLPELQKKLGQTIVLDYKAGAGGTIATSALARAKPDGQTILMILTAHAINDALYPKLPYDTRKDFAPISLIATLPLLVAAPLSSPFNTIPELIAYAKANPDKLSYASAGNGNTSHLSVELFKTQTGTKMIHIPYKGSGPAVIAMLGNEVSFMFDSISTSFQQVKAGKLKAIAVSSLTRAEILPNTPTIADTLPGFDVTVWYGILAPAGTPVAIVDKLSQAFAAVASDSKIKAQLAESGYATLGSTPAAFGKHIDAELTKWSKAVKDSGATIQ